MKFYENLDHVERKKLILRAVATSSHLEGMDTSVKACLDNLAAIERWDRETLLEAVSDLSQDTVMDDLGDTETKIPRYLLRADDTPREDRKKSE